MGHPLPELSPCRGRSPVWPRCIEPWWQNAHDDGRDDARARAGVGQMQARDSCRIVAKLFVTHGRPVEAGVVREIETGFGPATTLLLLRGSTRNLPRLVLRKWPLQKTS